MDRQSVFTAQGRMFNHPNDPTWVIESTIIVAIRYAQLTLKMLSVTSIPACLLNEIITFRILYIVSSISTSGYSSVSGDRETGMHK